VAAPRAAAAVAASSMNLRRNRSVISPPIKER
jgi:hypothetical protein